MLTPSNSRQQGIFIATSDRRVTRASSTSKSAAAPKRCDKIQDITNSQPKKKAPGRRGMTDPWLPGDLRAVRPSLLRTDHRAAIEFAGDSECDLPGSGRGQDVVVRQELAGRVAGSERYLHFLPQRIEAVSLDRIQHTDKRLAAR